MKICVLNGSPKGEMSATLQYIKFLELIFSQHEFEIIHAAQSLPHLEKSESSFQDVMTTIQESDGVFWAFPLYVGLVHSNYKRFIELIFERNVQDAFKDKYAAAISTSIHFHDQLALNYIHAICDDLNMKFVDYISLDMYDLIKEERREQLRKFGKNFFDAIQEQRPTPREYQKIEKRDFEYTPGKIDKKIDNAGKRIVLLTDVQDPDSNLKKMIERFVSIFKDEIEVHNLHDVDIKGSCLGCIRCGYDNTCAYTGKDGYIEFYNKNVRAADILIYAGSIKDRYLSSKWKQFFDRSFFNTHAPSIKGRQVGIIISGPLSQIPNLRELLKMLIEIQEANIAGIVTDEFGTSEDIDALLEDLAKRLVTYSEMNYVMPQTFRGIGGAKIFRDDIYGRLRLPFQADHRYYKKHHFYDFPKGPGLGERMIILMMKSRRFREVVFGLIKQKMIEPHQKILKKIEKDLKKSD
ncbi:MAG: NAD(P)H-dependent oxidoreductase [Candidatus Helarchaeales archaeon]